VLSEELYMQCKKCECHDFLESRGLGFNGDYRSRGHWCMAKVVVEYPNDIKAVYSINKPMTYKESIKIPEWCPKIQKIFKTKDCDCKIIEIRK
jgi:hypothetical protein